MQLNSDNENGLGNGLPPVRVKRFDPSRFSVEIDLIDFSVILSGRLWCGRFPYVLADIFRRGNSIMIPIDRSQRRITDKSTPSSYSSHQKHRDVFKRLYVASIFKYRHSEITETNLL
jgi:hypothetical protein